MIDKDGHTEVQVRFTPNAGGTRVGLEHRAWDVLGARAEPTRDRYDSGWPGVLDRYAAAA